MYTLILRHRVTRVKLILSAMNISDLRRAYLDLEYEYRFEKLEYYNPEIFDSDVNRKLIKDAKEFLLL